MKCPVIFCESFVQHCVCAILRNPFSCRFYCKLIKIPAFKLFRKWRSFTVWRTNVTRHKTEIRRKSLQENLFLLNGVRVSLLDFGFFFQIILRFLFICSHYDQLYSTSVRCATESETWDYAESKKERPTSNRFGVIFLPQQLFF